MTCGAIRWRTSARWPPKLPHTVDVFSRIPHVLSLCNTAVDLDLLRTVARQSSILRRWTCWSLYMQRRHMKRGAFPPRELKIEVSRKTSPSVFSAILTALFFFPSLFAICLTFLHSSLFLFFFFTCIDSICLGLPRSIHGVFPFFFFWHRIYGILYIEDQSPWLLFSFTYGGNWQLDGSGFHQAT